MPFKASGSGIIFDARSLNSLKMTDGGLSLEVGSDYYLVVGKDHKFKPVFGEVRVISKDEVYYDATDASLVVSIDGKPTPAKNGILEGKEVTFTHARNENLHMTVRRVESR